MQELGFSSKAAEMQLTAIYRTPNVEDRFMELDFHLLDIEIDELIDLVKGQENRVVVPGANNKEALTAIKMADDKGLISHGILIGDTEVVKKMVREVGLPEEKFEFIQCTDVPEMCNTAARMVYEGKGDFLVKGLVDTKYYIYYSGC